MSEDPYYQRAEFLVAREYVPAGTNIDRLADKLRKADELKKEKHVNSRSTVYGEAASTIERLMDDKAPVKKRLLRPYESVANKKDLNSP